MHDGGWKSPVAGDADAQFGKRQAQYLGRGDFLRAVLLQHHLADFRDFLGEIELCQQLADAVEQRADVRLLGFARHELPARVARQRARQVGAQEGFLQLAGAALVL